MTSRTRGKRRTREGIVVSRKMQKTAVVDVERVYRHPRYGKVVRSVSRCYVHDEEGTTRPGDRVRIMECRPLSRLKRWRLVEVVRRGGEAALPGEGSIEAKELLGERSGDEGADGPPQKE